MKPPEDDDKDDEEAEDEFDSGDKEILTKSGESSSLLFWFLTEEPFSVFWSVVALLKQKAEPVIASQVISSCWKTVH